MHCVLLFTKFDQKLLGCIESLDYACMSFKIKIGIMWLNVAII